MTTSVPRDSPIRDGSYVTSTVTSVPVLEPGAAATVLSAWKSEFSICGEETAIMNIDIMYAGFHNYIHDLSEKGYRDCLHDD